MCQKLTILLFITLLETRFHSEKNLRPHYAEFTTCHHSNFQICEQKSYGVIIQIKPLCLVFSDGAIYIQSNPAISNSVNSESPLFRRKIKFPWIYSSPLHFQGYVKIPLFQNFFPFPLGLQNSGVRVYYVFLTFESVDEIQQFYYSNETFSAILLHGAIYLVRCSNF